MDEVEKEGIAPDLAAFENDFAAVDKATRRVDTAEWSARSDGRDEFEGFNSQSPRDVRGRIAAANDCVARTRLAQGSFEDLSKAFAQALASDGQLLSLCGAGTILRKALERCAAGIGGTASGLKDDAASGLQRLARACKRVGYSSALRFLVGKRAAVAGDLDEAAFHCKTDLPVGYR